MYLLRQSRHIPIPPWVANPALLAADAKPIVIDVVARINLRAPGYDMWWTGTMSTRDRATRIVDELGRTAAPWAATCCADQCKINMFLVVQPHVVRALGANDDDDYLSQYDTRHNVLRILDCFECRQARYRDVTIGMIAAILTRCEREEQWRRSSSSLSPSSSSSSSWSLLRGLHRRSRKDFQNWVLRPELLAADLEPAAMQTIRDLNGGWTGAPEMRDWEAPLTTAQRVDLIHERLVRRLNDRVVAAAAEQRRVAEMLALIFAPHQVREIEPRLMEALLPKRGRHNCPKYKLTEAFWKEVKRSLLKLMLECEELSDEPSRCWLADISRWWNFPSSEDRNCGSKTEDDPWCSTGLF